MGSLAVEDNGDGSIEKLSGKLELGMVGWVSLV